MYDSIFSFCQGLISKYSFYLFHLPSVSKHIVKLCIIPIILLLSLFHVCQMIENIQLSTELLILFIFGFKNHVYGRNLL